MSDKSTGSFLSIALLSFHALYLFAMGVFALFFPEDMLLSITKNVSLELISLNRYFGLIEITTALFVYESIKIGKNRVRPLLYLIFTSVTSLYLMISKTVANGLGDGYFYFRTALLLLLIIALINEIKARM